MTRSLLLAAVLFGAVAPTVLAQAPAAGVRFRVQLISADTVPSTTRDPRVLRDIPSSGIMGQCVRPEPGKLKRDSRECGPAIRDSAMTVLADAWLTSDADGRARERLTWSGGDAVVELDATGLSRGPAGERMQLRIRFWPRLARGETAQPDSAIRMTHTAAPMGKALRMFVMFRDGAQILLVVPEGVGEGAAGRPAKD